MTNETRQNLKTLSHIFDEMSRKNGKISKSDLTRPVELIFDIINRGDVDFEVNVAFLGFVRRLVRNWLKK